MRDFRKKGHGKRDLKKPTSDIDLCYFLNFLFFILFFLTKATASVASMQATPMTWQDIMYIYTVLGVDSKSRE